LQFLRFFAKKIFLPAFYVSAGWVRSCGEYHINMRAVCARTYAYACVDSPHSLFCREGCSQELLLQVGVGQKQPVDARGFPWKSAVLPEISTSTAEFSKRLVNLCTPKSRFLGKVLRLCESRWGLFRLLANLNKS
jgi:hypothetical protein